MLPREQIMDTARRVFRSYGFSPIDTPALEYLEILLGKGGAETDKQLYRFQDHGGRDVGLRFDLTVPLARFAAQHISELGTPFKRYHIATSLARREHPARPLPRIHAVRLRHDRHQEQSPPMPRRFSSSTTCSRNRLRAIHDSRQQSPRAERPAANSWASPIRRRRVLRALDKLPKIGADKVSPKKCSRRPARRRAGEPHSANWQHIAGDQLTRSSTQLRPARAGNELGRRRRRPACRLMSAVAAAGVPAEGAFNSTSRSPAASTTTPAPFSKLSLDDLPTIGSICSGGRYDNLAELYTNQQLPGIGASLGLDRLLAAMEELNPSNLMRKRFFSGATKLSAV